MNIFSKFQNLIFILHSTKIVARYGDIRNTIRNRNSMPVTGTSASAPLSWTSYIVCISLFWAPVKNNTSRLSRGKSSLVKSSSQTQIFVVTQPIHDKVVAIKPCTNNEKIADRVESACCIEGGQITGSYNGSPASAF